MYFHQNTPYPDFMPMPRFLLKAGLSGSAVLLYTLLLSRTALSQKNGWVDEEGRIFVVYPLARMAEDLGCGVTTVKNTVKELGAAGLLRRVRRGCQKPNRLYLLCPDGIATQKAAPVTDEFRPSASVTDGICTSGEAEFEPVMDGKRPWDSRKTTRHDGRNLPGSYTEKKYNNYNLNFAPHFSLKTCLKAIQIKEFRNLNRQIGQKFHDQGANILLQSIKSL